jgi:hypothetical protein
MVRAADVVVVGGGLAGVKHIPVPYRGRRRTEKQKSDRFCAGGCMRRSRRGLAAVFLAVLLVWAGCGNDDGGGGKGGPATERDGGVGY